MTLPAGAARTLTAQQLEAGDRTTDSTEQPTATDGTCNVGLLLEAGGRCTYPGTSDAFTVTEDGRGRFLFFTSGGSIDLSNTTVNGRTYDFAASHQGNGVWRIDRVEGRTEASGGGNAGAGGAGTGNGALTGRLGAGTGKWRLTVSSDRPLEVLNIVASTAGYWNNLSTTAVRGPAPADMEAFSERFLGRSLVYEASGGRFTFDAMDGERFTETMETGGATVASMGSYGYTGVGRDAGRLALEYDDGDECRANLYFSTRTSGWFASRCTGGDDPDGDWIGGSWSVDGEDDDEGEGDAGDGEVAETAYGVNDALPGVPTSGSFVPAATSGGSVTATADGTTVALNNGGYIELSDGTRYTCTSAGGCTIANGTVTAGSVTGRAPGAGEADRFPSFRNAAGPGNRTYTAGTAIDALTLPEATGGNGTLTYGLSPDVPGLTFNAATRQLTGTPSAEGTHAMTYTATDEDGDSDALGFTITVSACPSTEGSLGVCRVGMTLSSGQSCTYPGTTDEFSVNSRGRGRFLTFLAGIRIRINNQTIDGRVYDFEASHRGDGVWRIDRVAGSTEAPANGGTGGADSSPSFAAGGGPGNRTYTVGTAIETLTLPEASGGNGALTYSLSPDVPGLTFDATTRQLTGTPSTAASYNMTYTASDEDGDTDSLGFSITVVPTATVLIPDDNLRAAIATALGKASDAPVTDIELASLTALQAPEKRIGDLTGLEAAVNLTRLVIWGNQVRDISALSDLAKLEWLSLGGNNIEDVSALRMLSRLTVLDLQENSITDISPLAGLSNLRRLKLGYNGLLPGMDGIADISALSGLTDLQSLELQYNNISDISALSGLTNLSLLFLGVNKFSDISALSGLTELRNLSLQGLEITDISALTGLSNLTELWLNGIDIMDISALSGLVNLKYLHLSHTGIADLAALSGLTELESLWLELNDIADLSAVSGLINLRRLELRGNKISNISALSGLTQLQWLDLHDNNVSDISAMAGLTGLETLDLGQNNIADIAALSGLTNLKELDLRGNLLNGASAGIHVAALEGHGVMVRYQAFAKGDFDIDLVFLDDFDEKQKNVLRYVARRWTAIVSDDLPDYEFARDWSGQCGDHQVQISAGESIDDVRIYVATFDGSESPAVGYGGPDLLRENHLPIVGCLALDLERANLLITGLHEVAHVLGFGPIWDEFGFRQNLSRGDPNADTHFNGPLAIAAFDNAGGSSHAGAKVPLQKMDGSHWRSSVFPGELMGPGGGSALSAVTVQSLADLGYGVDVTQADAYAVSPATTSLARANATTAIAAIAGDDARGQERESVARVGAYGVFPGDGGLTTTPAHSSQAAHTLSCGLHIWRELTGVADSHGRPIRISDD